MRKRKTTEKILTVLLFIIASVLSIIIIVDYEKPPTEDSSIGEKVKIISVDAICQYPELPTGCESVSAVMALRYCGEELEPSYFAENWLIKTDLYTKNDKIYGSHPNTAFIGSPFTNNGFGCYAPVIVRAVNSNSNKCKAEIISEKTIENLCHTYIDRNKPVLIWATMYMKEEKQGRSWYISDNEKFDWISGEHCLLLVGYDEYSYYFNDPMQGKVVKYQKSTVEKRYNALGKQAVLITKK